jgi:hypothetical protein
MRGTIDMAREAGGFGYVHDAGDEPYKWQFTPAELQAFEALVRDDEREEANRRANASWTLMCEKMVAIEREACAKLFDDHWRDRWTDKQVADAIRARGNT